MLKAKYYSENGKVVLELRQEVERTVLDINNIPEGDLTTEISEAVLITVHGIEGQNNLTELAKGLTGIAMINYDIDMAEVLIAYYNLGEDIRKSIKADLEKRIEEVKAKPIEGITAEDIKQQKEEIVVFSKRQLEHERFMDFVVAGVNVFEMTKGINKELETALSKDEE